MKTLRKILIVFAIILLLISAIGLLFFDAHVHVERSIVINTPKSELFKIVNSHQTFTQWSPWSEKDPNMKVTLSGPESGMGSKYSWVSDKRDVGKGSMQIIRSVNDSMVVRQLSMDEQGGAETGFVLADEGNSTKISWTIDMDAGANPMMRIMGSFMDKMIGPDFEKGLSNLKKFAEANAASPAVAQ